MGRRVRYTNGPAENSAGYGSRTSSTSLTILENILDDNGEGTKRVEAMLGPARPVKTGHLSIQVYKPKNFIIAMGITAGINLNVGDELHSSSLQQQTAAPLDG
ncbi:hypothetical protein RB195_003861 [Necator americanus]|uniref:Uncharacterized protein n=1 Tax=Necator americanus TaxID=51031 RepID=A0ABR1DQJ9_NECAM